MVQAIARRTRQLPNLSLTPHDQPTLNLSSYAMTAGGWINLTLSVGFVTVLFTYCLYRVLKGPGARHEHNLAHVEPLGETEAESR